MIAHAMTGQHLMVLAAILLAACLQTVQGKNNKPKKSVIKQAVKDAIDDCANLPAYGRAWATDIWCGTDKLHFQTSDIIAFVKEQEKTIMTLDPKYANKMMTKIWDKLREKTNIGEFEKAQNYTKCVYEFAISKLGAGNSSVVYDAGVPSAINRRLCNITKTRLFLNRANEIRKRFWRAGRDCGAMAIAAVMSTALCESAFAWVCFLPLMIWNHDQNPLPNWIRSLLRKTKHCMERAAMGYEYRYVHYSNYTIDMCQKENPPPADVTTEDAYDRWLRTGPCRIRVKWPEDKYIKHQVVWAMKSVCLRKFDENEMKETICNTLEGSPFNAKARPGRKSMKQFMADMNDGIENPEKVLKVLKKKGMLGPLKIFKAYQFFKCVQQVAGDSLYCPNAARSYSVMRKIKMYLCCKGKHCGTKYYFHHVFHVQAPEIFIMFGAKGVICLFAPHIACHLVALFIIGNLIYNTLHQMVTAVNQQHECTPPIQHLT